MHLLRLITICAFLALTLASPARALTLLRDPDIEYALKQLAKPLLQAAGLSASRIDILVIDDRNLNAFVVDQNHIFIHSGLLLKMKTPAMLQSVIAHEAAHIANGHLIQRPIAARNARSAAGIGTALAVAAGIAAGNGAFAAGAAAGVQGAAIRRFFGHTRAQESAADQSGLRFMASAGVDPQGAVDVIELFRGQEALSVRRQDAYARTHPLSSDRYRVIQRLAAGYAGKAREDAGARYWFARAKSKLSAFQRAPKWTLTRAGEYGYADVKLMRQAVAYHRQSNTAKALKAIDAAIAQRPKDPFYRELKGQILLESRQFNAAVSAYGSATKLAPNDGLIMGAYGRALLTTGQVKTARDVLERARSRDGRDIRVLRDLAAAHAKLGNKGQASVLTAERYAASGRFKDATIHAQRASDLLPRGSAAWQRAQDVLSAAKAAQQK